MMSRRDHLRLSRSKLFGEQRLHRQISGDMLQPTCGGHFRSSDSSDSGTRDLSKDCFRDKNATIELGEEIEVAHHRQSDKRTGVADDRSFRHP